MSSNESTVTAPESKQKLKLEITRVFNAPRSLVYQMWTNPEHMRQWSCPQGFTIAKSEGEVKPEGKWRSCMISPQGEEMWLGGMYLEVVEDELLVFTHFWDEDGAAAPITTVTVRFYDEGEGKTKMVFEQVGFGSQESRDGHEGGWTECFGKLEGVLAEG